MHKAHSAPIAYLGAAAAQEGASDARKQHKLSVNTGSVLQMLTIHTQHSVCMTYLGVEEAKQGTLVMC